MPTGDQPALGWTVVLRRQPARIVDGRPRGGYTNAFELICCDCGDHPGLDYHDVSPELQQTRGPYPIAAAVTAYEQHLHLRHRQQPIHQPDRPVRDAGTPEKLTPGGTAQRDRGKPDETCAGTAE